MDFVALILFGVVKVLPEKAAMPVIAAVLGVLAVLSFSWRSHVLVAVAYCASGQGQFEQLLNGSARSACGFDSLLAVGLLLAGLALLAVALLPVGMWCYQLSHPTFSLKKRIDDII